MAITSVDSCVVLFLTCGLFYAWNSPSWLKIPHKQYTEPLPVGCIYLSMLHRRGLLGQGICRAHHQASPCASQLLEFLAYVFDPSVAILVPDTGQCQ